MSGKFGILSDILKGVDVKSALFDPNKEKRKKQKRYDDLMKGINVYSHSTSERFLSCERKFSITKLQANTTILNDPVVRLEGNIDFAFGRAVETGIQSALLKNSKTRIFFDMFCAWDIGLMVEHPKGIAKTFTDAVIAIDQFLWIQDQIMQGWEIAMFKGKPAIELSLLIDLENGYYYVGHADIILYHPVLRRYRVLEIKTTGSKNVHPAMYKNSGQSTGYSVFLDEIARDVELTATFEVFYLVWPTALNSWRLYEFVKSRSNRADWLNTLMIDIQKIRAYREMNFWPKRGSSCFEYGRPCQYLDTCDLTADAWNQDGQFAIITEDDLQRHEFDFKFKLSDIVRTQKELIGATHA